MKNEKPPIFKQRNNIVMILTVPSHAIKILFPSKIHFNQLTYLKESKINSSIITKVQHTPDISLFVFTTFYVISVYFLINAVDVLTE